jgi:MoaA/NifB/PqqE/SkfB family radical SAM enzyme
MEEMKEIGVSRLHIDGGEPFERDDVLDLLDYAVHDEKFITSIATNASLLNKDKVAEIDDSVQVLVRIDGCEESHEFVRGVNTYKPTIRGLDVIIGMVVGIVFVCTLHALIPHRNNLGISMPYAL